MGMLNQKKICFSFVQDNVQVGNSALTLRQTDLTEESIIIILHYEGTQ